MSTQYRFDPDATVTDHRGNVLPLPDPLWKWQDLPACKVTLVGLTMDPRIPDEWSAGNILARVSRTFSGTIDPSPVDETVETEMLREIRNMPLGEPIEMVDFVWLIQNVTRAFTHQIVRYRVGTSRTQESMRVLGARTIPLGRRIQDTSYDIACEDAVLRYWDLRTRGISAEDARDVLPHNTLTSIWFKASLRTLAHVFKFRTSVQAQPGEWSEVMRQMYEQVPANLQGFLRSCCDGDGPCPFASMWDLPCKKQVGK